MSRFDDDEDVMADDMLAGRSVPGREPLADVLGLLRAMADEPAPPPSPALAAVLRDGLPAAVLDPLPPAAGAQSWLLRGARWAAGLGVAAKVLLGAGVAMAAVAGTATLPLVPPSVQVPVRTALTDLGHLIPGSAGGSVPVPAVTTPEPVVGVAPSGDRPPAEPELRDSGVETDRSHDQLATPPALGDEPAAGRSTGVLAPRSDSGANENGKATGGSDGRPTAPPVRPSQAPEPTRTAPTGDPTTSASDRNNVGTGQTDQSHD